MKYIDSEKLIAEIDNKLLHEQGFEDGNSEYGYKCALKDIKRAITSLQQEQPAHPSNLDEAAEKYSENILANNEDLQDAIEDAFKAGAEWMAGQGVTKEAVIGMATEEISINVSQHTLNELYICPGDKVVVQIRKK